MTIVKEEDMEDSYYGPRLKRREQESMIGPSEENVQKILNSFAKKLGVEYAPKKDETTQEQKEIDELGVWLDFYR